MFDTVIVGTTFGIYSLFCVIMFLHFLEGNASGTGGGISGYIKWLLFHIFGLILPLLLIPNLGRYFKDTDIPNAITLWIVMLALGYGLIAWGRGEVSLPELTALKKSSESWLEKILVIGILTSCVVGIAFSDEVGLSPRLLGGPPALICFAGLIYSRRRVMESWMVLPVVLLFAGFILVPGIEAYHHFRGSQFRSGIGLTLLAGGPFMIALFYGTYKNEKDKK